MKTAITSPALICETLKRDQVSSRAAYFARSCVHVCKYTYKVSWTRPKPIALHYSATMKSRISSTFDIIIVTRYGYDVKEDGDVLF